jgi:D-alanine-D-alanine ligase
VDFLVERTGTPWLSEINTIPGFTPISLFPMLVASAGHDFGAVCERIVGLALERATFAPQRQLSRADLP